MTERHFDERSEEKSQTQILREAQRFSIAKHLSFLASGSK